MGGIVAVTRSSLHYAAVECDQGVVLERASLLPAALGIFLPVLVGHVRGVGHQRTPVRIAGGEYQQLVRKAHREPVHVLPCAGLENIFTISGQPPGSETLDVRIQTPSESIIQ